MVNFPGKAGFDSCHSDNLTRGFGAESQGGSRNLQGSNFSASVMTPDVLLASEG